MGWACNLQGILVERWKVKSRLEYLCVPWNWIHLAQERGKLWALVNSVTNIRVPQNVGKFLTNGGTIRFSKRICSTEILGWFVCWLDN
jgi:hypothetical protein